MSWAWRRDLGGTVSLRRMSHQRCREMGPEAKRGSIRSLLLLYLHIPSILTSVAFRTSLSFSFVMDPVIVT